MIGEASGNIMTGSRDFVENWFSELGTFSADFLDTLLSVFQNFSTNAVATAEVVVAEGWRLLDVASDTVANIITTTRDNFPFLHPAKNLPDESHEELELEPETQSLPV